MWCENKQQTPKQKNRQAPPRPTYLQQTGGGTVLVVGNHVAQLIHPCHQHV
jgi:hypothetical protein